MNEIKVRITDITDDNKLEKFSRAVESISKALDVPITIKPQQDDGKEKFRFKAQEQLVDKWAFYFAGFLDRVYKTV
jgi:hypothetical protein